MILLKSTLYLFCTLVSFNATGQVELQSIEHKLPVDIIAVSEEFIEKVSAKESKLLFFFIVIEQEQNRTNYYLSYFRTCARLKENPSDTFAFVKGQKVIVYDRRKPQKEPQISIFTCEEPLMKPIVIDSNYSGSNEQLDYEAISKLPLMEFPVYNPLKVVVHKQKIISKEEIRYIPYTLIR